MDNQLSCCLLVFYPLHKQKDSINHHISLNVEAERRIDFMEQLIFFIVYKLKFTLFINIKLLIQTTFIFYSIVKVLEIENLP